MFSDPQFWVAVAFVAFIAAVFNPVRKMLTTNLDAQIKDIKDKIEEAENLKNETQVTLSEIKQRQNDVKSEIQAIQKEAESKVKQIEQLAEGKLKDKKYFIADKILAKHDENYMPPEVKKALEQSNN